MSRNGRSTPWGPPITGWRCRCCQAPSRHAATLVLDGTTPVVALVPSCDCPYAPPCAVTQRCTVHCKCVRCEATRSSSEQSLEQDETSPLVPVAR